MQQAGECRSTLTQHLGALQTEEFYVITWEAKKEQIFEMPTGGAAIMRKGPNLLKFATKEQCLALTTQLRTKLKLEPCFYRFVGFRGVWNPVTSNGAVADDDNGILFRRVFPDGKVQYLHPLDGVYPEKVNAGRVLVNCNMRRIGQNVNPIKVNSGFIGVCQVPSQSTTISISQHSCKGKEENSHRSIAPEAGQDLM